MSWQRDEEYELWLANLRGDASVRGEALTALVSAIGDWFYAFNAALEAGEIDSDEHQEYATRIVAALDNSGFERRTVHHSATAELRLDVERP